MEETLKIEEKLLMAKERYKQAIKALAPKHKGGEREEFQAAFKNLKSLEREFSLANFRLLVRLVTSQFAKDVTLFADVDP